MLLFILCLAALMVFLSMTKKEYLKLTWKERKKKIYNDLVNSIIKKRLSQNFIEGSYKIQVFLIVKWMIWIKSIVFRPFFPQYFRYSSIEWFLICEKDNPQFIFYFFTMNVLWLRLNKKNIQYLLCVTITKA